MGGEGGEGVLAFLRQHLRELAFLTVEHLLLVVVAMVLAVITGVMVGILISRREWLARPILYLAGIIMTVPSVAMLGLLLPVVGIGKVPAVIALVLYGQLPILRNTYTGIKGVEPAVLESARGMGMTPLQVLRRIELPLAYPVILTGVRVAVVMNIGIAAIAAFIGAGGLGRYIYWGIARTNDQMVIAGVIFVAILAVVVDWVLGRVERRAASG